MLPSGGSSSQETSESQRSPATRFELASVWIGKVGGASATKRSFNLDRHWRNARTLASHNPGTYKARAIGDHVINGTPLPINGFF